MEDLKSQAIRLRLEGKSYNQIVELIGVPKSTASYWLRDLKLSLESQEVLLGRSLYAVQKSIEVGHKRKNFRREFIKTLIRRDFCSFKLDPFLSRVLCSFLYWSEGSKRNAVVFMNSDPEMIKVFLNLLKTGFSIDIDKLYAWLHLHDYHDREASLDFWSKVTGIHKNRIKIYNKLNSGKIIRDGYPGCISIRYGDVLIYEELTFIYQTFAEYLGA